MNEDFTRKRLKHLDDHIHRDISLLKELEDELRYETDPRNVAKYRRDIERLREYMASYQQEYNELRRQVIGDPPAEMQDTADMLQQMNAKLDDLRRGQGGILDGLKASEQAIISTIVQRLDQNQLATVQSILDEIEAHRVPEKELRETLSAVQQSLSEIEQKEAGYYDSQLVCDVAILLEVVDDPKLDVNHKLKVSVPIIPLLITYETEVGLKSGLNLKAVWQHLKARVRGKG